MISERDFQRGIYGLRAGSGEEHVLEFVGRKGAQTIGKFKRDRVTHLERRRIVHFQELVICCLRDRFIAVARVAAPQPRSAVEHLAPFDVGVVDAGRAGQQPGLGGNWEIWSFARGGFSGVEALKTATIYPAQSLGMEKDVGSLEVGKLADLVVLTADPTINVRDSDKIESVMIGGRMYDAKTMQEVVTGNGGRRTYWWEAGMGGNAGGSQRATHAGGGHNHGDGDGDSHSY